jgi:hypothetical protein
VLSVIWYWGKTHILKVWGNSSYLENHRSLRDQQLKNKGEKKQTQVSKSKNKDNKKEQNLCGLFAYCRNKCWKCERDSKPKNKVSGELRRWLSLLSFFLSSFLYFPFSFSCLAHDKCRPLLNCNCEKRNTS